MGLFKDYVSQTRKPEGFLGKMMLTGMNTGHAKLADWGLGHLHSTDPEKIVDLGCGGGRNAGELLKMYPEAHVTAVDYSELSVEKAKKYNKEMIAAGRCNVQQGDATNLDFPDETFDAVASNYVYHNIPSKDRQAILLETLRTLKKGGTFAIHDIFSVGKNGDMNAFVKKLKEMGYEKVSLIDTTDGKWIRKSEAGWMGLSGSALLTGIK